jgi:GNAT superfamily N-acetyltransferase
MTTITTTDRADPELRSRVQAILRSHNRPFGVGSPDARPLVVQASAPDGGFIGGGVAETFWSWVVVDVLAVVEVNRARGVGSALAEAIEAEARVRGCTRAHTQAWAFQGLGFWIHRGYEVVGELNDYPDGHTLCWLRRDL